MNLSAGDIPALRKRSSWEAADSGILLWRDSFVYFIPLFALPVWIAAFALRLLPEFLHPWSYLFLWWLKPLFDRPVLHVISVRFFEPRSGMFRLFRGLGGDLLRGLPGDLLWRRFSPWRSARMPVRLLEKLRGKNLRQRRGQLEKGGSDFCLLLSVLGLLLESALLAGELLFAGIMLDLFRPDLNFNLFESFAKFEIFIFAIYCFNFILVESLYVCMGFGLYINSRVEVEGWDIQLLFRNFSERKAGPRYPALLFLAALFFILPPEIRAQGEELPGAVEENPVEEDLSDVKILIPGPRRPLNFREDLPPVFSSGPEVPLGDLQEILASPDFGGERESWGIRFKTREDDEEEDPGFSGIYASRIKKMRQALAFMLRLFLAAVLGTAAGFFLYRFFKHRRGGVLSPGGPLGRRLASPPAEDPRLLLDRAAELYGEGKIRAAWALCFAGTIAAYTRFRGLFFPPNATEYDCLALVRDAEAAEDRGTGGAAGEPGSRAAGFEALVRRRIRFAYAGRVPEQGDFESSLGFGLSLLESPALKGEAHG